MQCGILINITIDDKKRDFSIVSNIAEIPSVKHSPTVKEKISTVISSVKKRKKLSFSSHYLLKLLGCDDVEHQLLPLGGFVWDKEGMSKSGNIVSRLTLGKDGSQTIIDFSGKVVFFRKLDDNGDIEWFDCSKKEHLETMKQMISLFDVSIVPFAKVD